MARFNSSSTAIPKCSFCDKRKSVYHDKQQCRAGQRLITVALLSAPRGLRPGNLQLVGAAMARAWFAFYPGDFLADTEHLNATETGAYWRLIIHYYQHNGLGSGASLTDVKLAFISHLHLRTWRQIKPTVAAFFQMPDWRHKRIDAELEKINALSLKRAVAGKKGWVATFGQNNNERFVQAQLRSSANAGNGARQLPWQTGTQSQSPIPRTSNLEISEGQPIEPELARVMRNKGWIA
jgi:uncharacterized protein YdaU (DUF1376 family)